MAKQYGETIPFPKQRKRKLPVIRKNKKNLEVISSKTDRRPKDKWYQRVFCTQPLDYTIVFLVLFLTMFGLVMVYSTSSYKSSVNYDGDTTHWLVRQLIFAIIGVVLMFGFSFVNYHVYQKTWVQVTCYVGIAVVLLAILVMGVARKGAKRWTSIAGVNVQPSELAKIILIIFLAFVITNYIDHLGERWGAARVFLVAAPIIGLVGVENMSTAMILMVITIVMIFISSKNLYSLIVVLVIGGIGAAVLLFTRAYRMERILIWLNPEGYENGRQTLQGLYAIGSGGIFGKGLGQSMQKMGFVPESHNDMIFSIICEELGLFGAIAVLALFVILLWRFMIIAINAKDLFGSLIVIGVIAHLGMQVFINVAVVTNVIPNTGIPLPFISYGGSSLICLLMEMGIVLSVSRQIKVDR